MVRENLWDSSARSVRPQVNECSAGIANEHDGRTDRASLLARRETAAQKIKRRDFVGHAAFVICALGCYSYDVMLQGRLFPVVGGPTFFI